ncbi:acetyltransferase (GNAT) family protein [Micromonospora pisi]|uniref:Acetyltransferase (GNAT) family protein n=1 Tax=Micromonospora pisi TaxID=589240 RepID=A0A495JNQ4_9ACTN|nr:GNAT family N-acetyltransferase [Micromonospora pisi]RKR90573.1 acetyltransferase (GNAT) family protein [Micromonospora pisi]
MLDTRLFHHLVSWLGQWPTRRPLHVVGSERRILPAWDGQVRPALGVAAPEGTVLSVPPDRVAAVRELTDRPLDDLLAALPAAVGDTGWRTYPAVFRYSLAPTPLPDAGQWVPADDPTLPAWLRPFGDVLVARDSDGEYLAGVGIKRHDRYGHELSVGTSPAARGRGLARRLVAQAARRVLDEGAVPTYLHAPENAASARVAEAAGFPSRGWMSYGVFKAE